MGEQLGACAPARDWMRWGRRLRDRFAGPAGELLAHVLDHFPPARDELQRLGHILTDLAQCPAPTARAGPGPGEDATLARRVPRQPPARRPPPVESPNHHLLPPR